MSSVSLYYIYKTLTTSHEYCPELRLVLLLLIIKR
jgi:hypothetical protein